MKSHKLFDNKLLVGFAAAVLTFALLGCSLFYQIKAADTLVKKATADQKEADKTLEKAASFDSEIDSLKPTEDSASTIVSKTTGLKENVKTANEDLDTAKKKLKAVKKLRLPDWYKKKYVSKLEEVVDKKEEGLKEMEKMLAKTENYGKSVQGWYKGYHNYKQAELNLNNFFSMSDNKDYQGAASEGEKAKAALKNAQTEFNNAASFVNVKIYSDARDAVGIYAEMMDPLQKMINILQQFVSTPQQNLTIDMLNNWIAQIETLSAQIQDKATKGDAIFPKDIPEDGALPQSGLDELSQWRKENVKTYVSKIKDVTKEAEDLKDDAASIRSAEK